MKVLFSILSLALLSTSYAQPVNNDLVLKKNLKGQCQQKLLIRSDINKPAVYQINGAIVFNKAQFSLKQKCFPQIGGKVICSSVASDPGSFNIYTCVANQISQPCNAIKDNNDIKKDAVLYKLKNFGTGPTSSALLNVEVTDSKLLRKNERNETNRCYYTK